MFGLMARATVDVTGDVRETFEALGVEVRLCCSWMSVISNRELTGDDLPFWTRRFASWRERKGRVFLGVAGPILMVSMSTPPATRG